jgi:hypothetical protein
MSRWLAYALLGSLCACGAPTENPSEAANQLRRHSATAPASCADRKGGAFITFGMDGGPAAPAEQFTVWSTNAAFISDAIAAKQSGDRRTPMFDKVIAGSDCDSAYHWHVDPAAMAFSDFATEVCDGRPSYLEANLSTWIQQVGNYCPWGVAVVSIDDRR